MRAMPRFQSRESTEWAFGADRLKPFMDGTDPQVNPLIVRYHLEEMQRRGLDAQPLLDGLDFSVEDLQRPDFRLRYAQASEAIWRMTLAIQDPDLGLIIGQRHHILSWGLVGLGAMASATLGDAAALGWQHQEEAGSLVSLRPQTTERHVSIVAEPRFADVTIERTLVDGVFAALVQAGRLILDAHFKPLAVELVSRQVASIDLYREIFQCPVLFGSLENKLVFSLEMAASPIGSADSAVLKMVTAWLIRERASPHKATDARNAVESMMQDQWRAPPTPAALATSLGLNERTLRRKLAQEGTTYHGILDMQRRSRAIELILLGHQAPTEVAAALGFADIRGLGRAFKRWTGHPLPSP